MKTHKTLKPITEEKFYRFARFAKGKTEEELKYHRKQKAQLLGMGLMDYETIRVNFDELNQKFH